MMRRLRVLTEASSLGGVETLVSMLITSSQFNVSEKELTEAGIPPGMVLLSIGIEEPEDIISASARCLTAVVTGLSKSSLRSKQLLQPNPCSC